MLKAEQSSKARAYRQLSVLLSVRQKWVAILTENLGRIDLVGIPGGGGATACTARRFGDGHSFSLTALSKLPDKLR